MERLIRYTPEEKMETIRLVEHSDLSVKQTLRELQVPPSTFYDWYRHYQELGFEGLKLQAAKMKAAKRQMRMRFLGIVALS